MDPLTPSAHCTTELDFHASGFLVRTQGNWTDGALAQFRHFLKLRHLEPTTDELVRVLELAKQKYSLGNQRLYACAAQPCCNNAGYDVSEPELSRLGNQIGADKRVLAATESFAPGDTIYASIATQGQTRGAVIAARWSYEDGQTVAESSETVASGGPTVVEFHIAKPDGWPTGRYRVDVTADGRPAGTRQFEVR